MGDFGKKDDGIYEIRWHGRGGQGAVSSAQLLAEAAYRVGFLGVTATPSFGAERRGAPITASTRLSPEPIRVLSQIETPDVVLVLDETLLATAGATAGLKKDGWIIINSPKSPEKLGIEGNFSIATADATAAARKAGLMVAGLPMVNTAMLGAFARATGLISLESINEALVGKFSAQAARINSEAAKLTYDGTRWHRRNRGD